MVIETLRSLSRAAGIEDLPARPVRTYGMGTFPYDSAGHGRRGLAWNPPKLGQNTLLYSHGAELLSRSRDAVRNSGWASAAIDSYVANAIGRGIRLVPQHPDSDTRDLITAKWNRWIRESDVEYDPANPCSGQTDFYGQQMIIAREIMEAGECFVQFIPRRPTEGLTVPLQLDLIESEQLPLWRMTMDTIPEGNAVRMGIEWNDKTRRRVAYHFWKAHPGETMFYPLEGLQTERIPARDILHCYKPIRAKQMRGQPWLTSVLAKLYELDQLFDAEIVKKKVASMITGFVKQVSGANGSVIPKDANAPATDPATQISKLEPGSFPVLFPGEDIAFAEPPQSGDFVATIKCCLRAFAAGAGITYEQLGDLEGVNYSSIRAGLLEFRRKCEQFQHSVFIFQVCHPIYRRWMREAMLALVFGVPALNAYADDPEPWEAAMWVTPGWPWVDPEKDIAASNAAIRNGLSDRSTECASQGRESAQVDAQQKIDNDRADALSIPYDSDARKILTGRSAGLDTKDIEKEVAQGNGPGTKGV